MRISDWSSDVCSSDLLGTDGNGVTTFTATTTDVDDHSTYGRFDFAKVGSYDLYFGEWSQTGSATAGDHTVYYGGTGATSSGNMPSSGLANYTVKGISNYASSGTPLRERNSTRLNSSQ